MILSVSRSVTDPERWESREEPQVKPTKNRLVREPDGHA
jgi:hypothetical protein